MEINQSTKSGNLEVIQNLFTQAGLHKPASSDHLISQNDELKDCVYLVHGDLLTGERIYAVQHSCAPEESPWDQFQYIIFVFGLFHLQMACVDALYRNLLKLGESHYDKGGFSTYLKLLQPKDWGKIFTGTPFRVMHTTFIHAFTAIILETWRVMAQEKNSACDNLEAFQTSKPLWDVIVTVSETIMNKYVASAVFDNEWNEGRCTNDSDQENKNMKLCSYYLLLYMNFYDALNCGDIGCIEYFFLL